jgi:hypothetical protein
MGRRRKILLHGLGRAVMKRMRMRKRRMMRKRKMWILILTYR